MHMHDVYVSKSANAEYFRSIPTICCDLPGWEGVKCVNEVGSVPKIIMQFVGA